jgi:hypothetical protein
MAEELPELPPNTIRQTVQYKGKDGAIKTLHVLLPLDPDQRRLTFADIQMLAKQISIQLQKDSW